MSIISLEIDDPTPVYFCAYEEVRNEVGTTFGKVTELTKLLANQKKEIEAKKEVQASPELQKQLSFKKMVQIAKLAFEIYVFYALPTGLISLGFSKVSKGFANSLDGLAAAVVLGAALGGCMQLFFRNFYKPEPIYACNCNTYHYENLRYEVLTLLKNTEAKVELFRETFEKEEGIAPLVLPIKKDLNNATLSFLHSYPPSCLL